MVSQSAQVCPWVMWSFLRSTERILITLFFSPADFTMSRGYWSRMPDHFRLWPPSWTDWHTWPRSHACLDPMPDKMNFIWISKVRVYDHVCSKWSAKKKKTRTSQLESNKTHRPRWLLLVNLLWRDQFSTAEIHDQAPFNWFSHGPAII